MNAGKLKFGASVLYHKDLVLGVDGGGTKTHAVLLGSNDEVVGEGITGPSNPLRVGVAKASAAIREAVDKACNAAGADRSEIIAAKVGLAGVRRNDIRSRMLDALSPFGIKSIEVVTDAEIALFGATGGSPGLVIIAGTGSVCCGTNARGRYVFAGGWGPLAGDEGSASWVARRALQLVARASDGRGNPTKLSDAACDYFQVTSADDLSTAIYAPSMTNDRIAGFAKYVLECAQDGDSIARMIFVEAGRELGDAAVAVIRRLRMTGERFKVGYVGGVFRAGDLILASLRQRVVQVAPEATLVPPVFAPAVAAARMARKQALRLALAG